MPRCHSTIGLVEYRDTLLFLPELSSSLLTWILYLLHEDDTSSIRRLRCRRDLHVNRSILRLLILVVDAVYAEVCRCVHFKIFFLGDRESWASLRRALILAQGLIAGSKNTLSDIVVGACGKRLVVLLDNSSWLNVRLLSINLELGCDHACANNIDLVRGWWREINHERLDFRLLSAQAIPPGRHSRQMRCVQGGKDFSIQVIFLAHLCVEILFLQNRQIWVTLQQHSWLFPFDFLVCQLDPRLLIHLF